MPRDDKAESENTLPDRLHTHLGTHGALASVLVEAYEQAAVGKGQERHGNGERFEAQQIVFFGLQARNASGVIFQACKKATEAQRLATDAAIRELLGAIVYLAAGVITLRKLEDDKNKGTK